MAVDVAGCGYRSSVLSHFLAATAKSAICKDSPRMSSTTSSRSNAVHVHCFTVFPLLLRLLTDIIVPSLSFNNCLPQIQMSEEAKHWALAGFLPFPIFVTAKVVPPHDCHSHCPCY